MTIPEVIDLFIERAGIMEHEAGISRAEAERLAMKDICERFGTWYRVPIEDLLGVKND